MSIFNPLCVRSESAAAGGKQQTKGKQARTWEMNGGGKPNVELDYSSKLSSNKANGPSSNITKGAQAPAVVEDDTAYRTLVGRMEGELRDLDVPEDDAAAAEEPDENEPLENAGADQQKTQQKYAVRLSFFFYHCTV